LGHVLSQDASGVQQITGSATKGAADQFKCIDRDGLLGRFNLVDVPKVQPSRHREILLGPATHQPSRADVFRKQLFETGGPSGSHPWSVASGRQSRRVVSDAPKKA
jgi:hypothetical protein